MKTLEYLLLAMAVMMLGLASCVKDLDFDGEQTDPLLVVNGVQQVGQPARLSVEKSIFFLDAGTDFRVKDVAVDLYVNGTFKESLQVRDSIMCEIFYEINEYGEEIEVQEPIYAFNYCEGQYLLCEGDHLRFEVHSSEFETATIELNLPEAPTVLSFDMVGVDSVESGIKFSFMIDDPAGADYYNLKCINPNGSMYSFYSEDPVFVDPMGLGAEELVGESGYYGYGLYNVFTDTYFNGKPYTVYFEVFSGEYVSGEQFTIEVSRVDESLYQYKKTYDAYQESDPNGMIGMFSEPVQVYSNVENAVGVVCAQSKPVVKTIVLNKEK